MESDAPRCPEFAPIAARFSSLGVNCELGLVQRWCAIEPLGLFRFAYTPLPGLVAALEDGLRGIADPEQIDITINGTGEYEARHRLYGFEFHTMIGQDTASEGDVRKHYVSKRLPLLSRMLLEDITKGEKILVFRAEGDAEEPKRLLAAVRKLGPAPLLWVTAADQQETAGKVSREGDGLLVGHLDYFAPLRYARGLSFWSWVSVLFDAHCAVTVRR